MAFYSEEALVALTYLLSLDEDQTSSTAESILEFFNIFPDPSDSLESSDISSQYSEDPSEKHESDDDITEEDQSGQSEGSDESEEETESYDTDNKDSKKPIPSIQSPNNSTKIEFIIQNPLYSHY